ncbi:signal recognition particle-docking protein FtsY [Thalassolituus marinus]|uniref:Signal recognition particle receptor FtsY n=1 Tax=Thalassolituus marinus TaxID=671053 RepID=A0ABS7ZPK1_9GAMM|nr:signal recognition particle-docking protein FtsY [Thalassolituus marinus]MCA6062416.1 signal recognition particle-docking protein FtsY [Thalassolituus marinus]
MFDFFKRKKKTQETAEAEEQLAEQAQSSEVADPEDTSVEEVAIAEAAVVAEPAADLEPEPEQALAEEAEETPQPEVAEEAAVASEAPALSAELAAVKDKPLDNQDSKKPGFFARIRQGLSKTRSGLTDGLANLLLGKKEIDEDLLEELETQLIMADVGVEATQSIMQRLTDRVSRKELKDSDALYEALISELQDTLNAVQAPLEIDASHKPYVILMVGINGVGKTTTIGKLAKQFQSQGKSVMLAAGDTFRAAAVEQLQVWGERNNVPVIAQHTGADSASVLFDALQAAQARKADILIADTAGRLHNKDNLMQELEKVVRVMKKLDDSAPHEVMLVLDAGTGQNAINQAKQFQQAVGVTGLTLTKLDGTAKGGIIFALAQQFGLPVRYIGVGEGIDDLRTFNAEEFTRALFQREAE